jgi:hypothetical protein
LEQAQVRAAKCFPRRVRELLCGALVVRDLYRDGDRAEAELAGGHAWYTDAARVSENSGK